jgi:beta-mannosidase
LGILVWQDFTFSCALYPGSEDFLKNVEQEAIRNVRRLRNHPCLALWCGNNEVETGWFDWGWKKKYPSSFWEDYRRLFLDLLPDICRRLDPQHPYWPSSPSSGLQDAPNSEKSGDVHFWGVWHGDLPYKAYEEQHPRFLSEYGFQSFPGLETLKAFASAQDLSANSPAMLWHQKTLQGNQRIVDSISRYYSSPQDFESLVYLSQVLQAEAIRTGAEHLRRSMPRCMGSLYWQVNDCWPGITWSGIDYFGRWKAVQYYARRFYSDVLLSFQVERDRIRVFVVSDKPTATPVTLHLRLLDFGGNSLLENRKELEIPPLESHVVTQLSLNEILAGRDSRRAFLVGELIVAGKSIFSNSLFFAEAKDIEWPTSTIRLAMKAAVGGPLI